MKPLFFISCPIDTYSGYGARSRDIVKALIKSDKYDIKIIPQRWGSTPFGFLNADNPELYKEQCDAAYEWVISDESMQSARLMCKTLLMGLMKHLLNCNLFTSFFIIFY